jgi:hypothetical protein
MMKLTAKEEKITRLALDPAAKDGERASAALKLIESLRARGATVESLQANIPVVQVCDPPPMDASAPVDEVVPTDMDPWSKMERYKKSSPKELWADIWGGVKIWASKRFNDAPGE